MPGKVLVHATLDVGTPRAGTMACSDMSTGAIAVVDLTCASTCSRSPVRAVSSCVQS